VSPQTAEDVASVIKEAGARFIDAGIVGGPPAPGTPGPVFYTSGPDAPELDILGQHGLRVQNLHAPIGAASGRKMSYAGITKGLTALGAAMMLAAMRDGVAPSLAAELADSQPELLAWFSKSVPQMYSKAHRWVAEMQEIAAFAEGDAATRNIYNNIAALYQALAQDQSGPRRDIEALNAFLRLAHQPDFT
jgi:3-hydroxyisobutyrate dehydrogenase-like beta-hydroxyacid dehydrogenase